MRLQEIPPDLRATLSLLLGQHKRYAEIAAMLSIEERAVHDRAHAALALLAPHQARELSAAQREQVGEYLLGQAKHSQQPATLAYLGSSAAANAWAQALAAELGPLASELPAIPAVGSTTDEPLADSAAAAAATGAEHPDSPASPTDPLASRPDTTASHPDSPASPTDPPAAPPDSTASQAPSSRRGGAILLGGLAVAVVVAVALIVGLGGSGGGGGGSSPSSVTTSTAPGASGGQGGSGGSTATTTSTSSSSAADESGKSGGSGKSGKPSSQPKLTATIPLTPTNSASKALGLVEVIAEGSEHAFIMAAERLPPTNGFHYAAWLYNTPTDAFFLGGGTTVGSNGTLKAAQGLPANAAHYATIILTEERSAQPRQPGPIVLSGPFKLG